MDRLQQRVQRNQADDPQMVAALQEGTDAAAEVVNENWAHREQ